jgi:hypothetical protein
MDDLIKELNLLWEPVQPFLLRQIEELYGRIDGHILEIGPFGGLVFALARKNVGSSFSIAAFPQSVIALYEQEARKQGLEDRVRIIESNSSLVGFRDESADLAVFRGALFFPALFQVDFKAIHRVLRATGVAFVGGGFGKYTPAQVISRIRERSGQLNDALGRARTTVETVRDQLRLSGLEGHCEIITEGGLWVLMRKK